MSRENPGKVVKTEKVYVYPMKADFVIKYRFYANGSTFGVAMPSEYCTAFPDSMHELFGSSVSAVKDAFDKAMREWGDSTIRVRKVILYRFSVNYSLPDADDPDTLRCIRSDIRSGFSRESISDTAVGFDYEVGFERIVNKDAVTYVKPSSDDPTQPAHASWKMGIKPPRDKNPRYQHDDDEGTDTRVIDWTAEREALFAAIQAQMVAMIQRIEAFEASLKDIKNLDDLATRLPAGGPLLLKG